MFPDNSLATRNPRTACAPIKNRTLQLLPSSNLTIIKRLDSCTNEGRKNSSGHFFVKLKKNFNTVASCYQRVHFESHVHRCAFLSEKKETRTETFLLGLNIFGTIPEFGKPLFIPQTVFVLIVKRSRAPGRKKKLYQNFVELRLPLLTQGTFLLS